MENRIDVCRTVAQVALRWLVRLSVAAIPFSSKAERIAGNFNVFDFELSGDAMARITALKRAGSRIANPVERVAGGRDWVAFYANLSFRFPFVTAQAGTRDGNIFF